jgi:5-methylcytosine-specific restriction enzyme A
MKKPLVKHIESEKEPKGSKRSDKWPKARKAFLVDNPTCAMCGGNKKLEVHHIRPFHLHPDLELDPKNFVTLCENKKDGSNCHLLFGHLGSFKSFNVNVVQDAAEWQDKIKKRPV